MSVWYECKGEAVFKISSGISIRTILKETLLVEGWISHNTNKINNNLVKVTFGWNNSMCGIDAANEVQKFIAEIKKFDRTAIVDLECNIRFLA